VALLHLHGKAKAMKKSLLILGGIGLLMFLLIIRLFFRQASHMTEEREWFASALRYEFSAQVDSVWMLNKTTGKLWCRVTGGASPQVDREDSLKRSFKEHDMLYLIFHKSADSIVFLVPYGNLVAKGDSVTVSSQKNNIQFFRDGNRTVDAQLSKTLTGFGRPFFLKGKRP
jgi:hypothetical protein